MTSRPHEDLLTVPEAAQLTGLSQAAIRLRVHRGTLPVVRDRHRVYLTREVVQRLGEPPRFSQAEYIAKVVAAAPDLTEDQKARIVAILGSAVGR